MFDEKGKKAKKAKIQEDMPDVILALIERVRGYEGNDPWVNWARESNNEAINVNGMRGREAAAGERRMEDYAREQLREFEERGLLQSIKLDDKIPFNNAQYEEWRKIRYRGRRRLASLANNKQVEGIMGVTMRKVIIANNTVAVQYWIDGSTWDKGYWHTQREEKMELECNRIGKVIYYEVS